MKIPKKAAYLMGLLFSFLSFASFASFAKDHIIKVQVELGRLTLQTSRHNMDTKTAPKQIRANNFKHWENDNSSELLVCVGSDANTKTAKWFLEEEYRLSWVQESLGKVKENGSIVSPWFLYGMAKDRAFHANPNWSKDDQLYFPLDYKVHIDDQENQNYRPPVVLTNSDLRKGNKQFLNMEQQSVRFLLVGKLPDDCKSILVDQLKKHRIKNAKVDSLFYTSNDEYHDDRYLRSHVKTIHNLTQEMEIYYKEYWDEAGLSENYSEEKFLPVRADEEVETLPINTRFNWEEYPFPKYNKDGSVVGGIVHLDNLEYLLSRYGIELNYNVISKKGEAKYPEQRKILLDNKEGQILEEIASLCALNEFPTSRLISQISAIANDNPCNPVLDYMTSRSWDGIDRLQDVISTVTVDDAISEWKSVAIKKFMKAAACAAINDEYKRWKFKSVLVFQGSQGIGKSPWIRLLTGDMVSYFLEGHILDPSSRDSCMAALETWITELGELDATVKKSDIAHQKAFLDAGKDKHRLPFAIRHSEMIRRTVFFGTVNPSQFLTDNTGNDRYWCIPVLDLDLDALEAMDIQQIWAQVYEQAVSELSSGIKRPWELTEEEELLQGNINESARVLSATEERLMDAFETVKDQPVRLYATITNIMDALGLKADNTKEKIIAESYIERTFGRKRKYKGKANSYPIPIPVGFESQLEYLVVTMKMKSN